MEPPSITIIIVYRGKKGTGSTLEWEWVKGAPVCINSTYKERTGIGEEYGVYGEHRQKQKTKVTDY